MELSIWIGSSANGYPMAFLRSNQSWWTPLLIHVIMLNVDVGWRHGKASIVVLKKNHDGEVLGLWYDKLDCSSTLGIELLAIKNLVWFHLIFQGKVYK